MYNLDDLEANDLTHMSRYIGELVFFNNSDSDSESSSFLKTLNNGEVVIYTINQQEMEVIFSEKLLELARKEIFLLDFYADVDEDKELYNIKNLVIYHRYFPWHE